MKDIHQLLEEHPFFADLDEASLSFIAGCGRNVRFEAGQTVYREGDPADTFYVIRRGRVAIEIESPGPGSLMIDTVDEGEILGISWLFPPYRWQFNARALEPTSAVGLDGACLRKKCDDDPRLGYALMQQIAEIMQRRLRSARVRLLDLYSNAGSG